MTLPTTSREASTFRRPSPKWLHIPPACLPMRSDRRKQLLEVEWSLAMDRLSHPGMWDAPKIALQPRAGIAFRVDDKTAIRADMPDTRSRRSSI